jgi:RNA polymerase sigma factor (sigma-70 family)
MTAQFHPGLWHWWCDGTENFFGEAHMTAQERQKLYELLEKAIRGDEQAISGVCEFIDRHMKQELLNRLSNAGAASSLDDAYQDLLLTVQHKLSQLKVVDAFGSWLRRLEMTVVKKYRPRYSSYTPTIPVEPTASDQRKQIGARTIQWDGKTEIAGLSEPPARQEQPPRRRLFEPVTDVIIAKASTSNRPNYTRTIDVSNAISELPKRWALAIQLVYFEGYSRTEAANFMDCSKSRIFKLLQKAKNRLRLLLPGYGLNGKAKPETRSFKVSRRSRTKRTVSRISKCKHPLLVKVPLRAI